MQQQISGRINKKQDQNFKIKITKPQNAHMKDRPLSYRMAAYDYLGLRSYNRTPMHLFAQCTKGRSYKKMLRYLKNHGFIVKIFSNKQFFIMNSQEPPKELLHHVVNNRQQGHFQDQTSNPGHALLVGKCCLHSLYKLEENVGCDYNILKYHVLQ